MILELLVQAAKAIAVSTSESPVAGYIVPAAWAIVIGMNAWVIRTTHKTRDQVRDLARELFGRKGDNGIAGDVHAHSEQLTDHELRITRSEEWIERTDEDRRQGRAHD